MKQVGSRRERHSAGPLPTLRRSGSASRHAAAQGFGLVELLVSLVIGLAISAAALSMLVKVVRSQQEVALDTRVTQDLRATLDTVTRSLRRAGHWAGAARSVPSATPSAAGRRNPLAGMTSSEAGDAVGVHYSRDRLVTETAAEHEQVGFRLREGQVQALIGAGRWQALTDPATVTVTHFQVIPSIREISLADLCAAECPSGSAICPPRLQVRHVAVEIAGHSPADPAVLRRVQASVGLRNDAVVGSCAP